MENQADLNLDADYTSAEQLLASLGEVILTDIPNSPDKFGDTFRYSAPDSMTVTGWNYGVAGLLDPLKRPDPNQIPPDVLGYLLKSGKFNEVLNGNNAVDFRRGTLGASEGEDPYQIDFLPMEGAKWTSSNNIPPQAQFQQNSWSTLNVTDTDASSTPNTQARFSGDITPPPRQPQNSYPSNLSPYAAEFVPRQYSTVRRQGPPSNDDESLLMQAIAEITQNQNFEQNQFSQQNQNRNSYSQPSYQQQQFPPRQQQQQAQYSQPRPHFQQHRGAEFRHQRPPYQPRNNSNSFRQRHSRPPIDYAPPTHQSPFESNADRVLTCMTDTITHLTHNPADFNALVKKTVRVLKESLNDSDTLEIVVMLIVEQSITQRNFSYSGAKLCQTLNDNRIQGGQLTAQNCVITHVQSVFESTLKSIQTTSAEVRERNIGLLFFLAELFVHFQMDTGKLCFGFGMAICEIMSKLIKNEGGGTAHENIKIVLNVLKLSGWELEQHANPKLKEDVQKLMNDLARLLTQTDIQPQTKTLIEKVFELRKVNWGRGDVDTDPSGGEATVESPSTVIYDGKSQETVYEEPSSSDDDAVYLDDESEEVNNFYDQFLTSLTAGEEKTK